MSFLSRFWQDRSGSPTAETVVVLSPLLVVFFAIADMTIVYMTIETSQKAAQMGARLAVTRSPIHGQVWSDNKTDLAIGQAGDTCFTVTGNDPCQTPPSSWVCDGKRLAPECSSTAFSILVSEIKRLYPSVRQQNVKVEYIYRRLGVAGGIFQPEVRVTIEGRSNFSGVRSIAQSLFPFMDDIRPAVASHYSEDLQS